MALLTEAQQAAGYQPKQNEFVNGGARFSLCARLNLPFNLSLDRTRRFYRAFCSTEAAHNLFYDS